jgi:hypothetical protein
MARFVKRIIIRSGDWPVEKTLDTNFLIVVVKRVFNAALTRISLLRVADAGLYSQKEAACDGTRPW